MLCQILTWQSLHLLSLVTFFCDFHARGLVHYLSPPGDAYLEIIVVTRPIPVLSPFCRLFMFCHIVSEEYDLSIRAYQDKMHFVTISVDLYITGNGNMVTEYLFQ